MSVVGPVAGLLDGLEEDLHALLVAQVGGEAALVAQPGGQAPVLEEVLEHVVALGGPPQSLGERGRAHRHEHELLDVEGVGGVGPAVEDVEHGQGQHAGVGPAQVAVEGEVELVGRGPGHGQGHAEDGVGAEAGLVGRAVEGEELEVEAPLVEDVPAEQGVEDLAVDAGHRPLHALAQVPGALVPALVGLVAAGGRPRRDDGPAPAAVGRPDLDLHRRVPPRVEDFSCRPGAPVRSCRGVVPRRCSRVARVAVGGKVS